MTFKINSLGLRDREVSVKRPKGIYRIIVLGDSATAGFGVELEETFPKQLEALVNGHPGSRRYEVLNCAVSGYNTFQERVYLDSKGLALEPNLVILAYNLNDFKEKYRINNLGMLRRTEDYADSHYSVDSYYSLVNLSELYLFLKVKYLDLKKRYFPSDKKWAPRSWGQLLEEYQEFYATGGDERWDQVKADLLEMASLAQRHGAHFLVVILPMRYQLNGDESSLNFPQDMVKRHLKRHRIPYLDLLPAFRNFRDASSDVLFIDFSHPASPGHALVAKELYRYLQAQRPDGPARVSDAILAGSE